MNKSLISQLAHALTALVFVVMPLHQAHGAPGALPNAPLFLSTIVEPNVFFTLDDSGSMNWETMVERSLTGGSITVTEASPLVNGWFRDYLHPDWYVHTSVVPPVSAYPDAWVLKNSDGNKLYYDPTVEYLPWAGLDVAGNPLYKDATPTKALRDPNNPTGTTTDLTAIYKYNDGIKTGDIYLPTYYVWIDDGDNIIHPINDKGTPVKIAAGTAEMQNFANWFVYYRSREYTAKAGVGRVINNSDAARMGLSVFNAGHQVDAATMTDPANKQTLLNTFYNVISSGTTPARTALENVGLMFDVDFASKPASPILAQSLGGECQQNFNILMSDGFYNGPEPTWGTVKIKSLNADEDTSNVENNGFDGDGKESVDDGFYEDSFSNTLADVAMHYYENDLADSILDEIPTLADVDEAAHQHLVTYTVSFGLTGSLDPKTQYPTDSGFLWTDPTTSALHKIDDMWHAAYNGRGKYLFANDATGIESQLGLAISDISERTGTAAAVAVNSAKLSTESVVYLAQFNTNRWQGNLFAFPIIDTDTGELAPIEKWDASSELTLRDLVGKPRTIITFNKSLATPDGVPFQWTKLSTDMKLDLTTNPAGGTDADAVGEARLEYIRGDRSNEGAGFVFRERISLLGDLVNSGPVFVGPPNLAWPDVAPFPDATGETYADFKNSSAKNRNKMVYIGANDGMLHALDDATGEELFGYIPGLAYSQTVNEGLHYLTDPNYIHNYYVDLSPTLSDVYYAGNWHTILIGGMRAGGRGYFALDVTNPASFSEANAANMVLWEFTGDDDADLGFSYSRPFIGLTNDGTWVAIFGNGYNDTGSGEATLFIVDIAAGLDGTWSAVDYKKISTGVGTTLDRNGLATPALADLDGNGTVDRVYAGDLKGNMWVFDLSSKSATNWGSAYNSGATPVPLFTARSDETIPTVQQITAKPVLASHPTQPDSGSPSNAPNVMVYFGTGQYLVSADKTSTELQSFYGVWDKGDSGLINTDLVEQTFDPSFTGRVLTRNPVDYATDHGWRFNLTESGERAVTSPIARGDAVFFNSFVPEEDPCSAGGFGFKFAVDMTTGGSPLEPTIDSNNDGVIDEKDFQTNGLTESTLAAVRQEGFLPEPVFIEDLAFTAEVATKIKALQKVPSGRFSWQELIH